MEKVNALTTNPGRLVLTTSRLYFQPFNNVYHDPVYKMRLSQLTNVVTRRYLLREKVCVVRTYVMQCGWGFVVN